MKMSTVEPAGGISLQLQAEGLDQYKSIEVARNCPRHKRQLQSQIWHLSGCHYPLRLEMRKYTTERIEFLRHTAHFMQHLM